MIAHVGTYFKDFKLEGFGARVFDLGFASRVKLMLEKVLGSG